MEGRGCSPRPAPCTPAAFPSAGRAAATVAAERGADSGKERSGAPDRGGAKRGEEKSFEWVEDVDLMSRLTNTGLLSIRQESVVRSISLWSESDVRCFPPLMFSFVQADSIATVLFSESTEAVKFAAENSQKERRPPSERNSTHPDRKQRVGPFDDGEKYFTTNRGFSLQLTALLPNYVATTGSGVPRLLCREFLQICTNPRDFFGVLAFPVRRGQAYSSEDKLALPD